MYPVRAGAKAPPKFPTKFCTPVQRPEHTGPARVCVTAQQCAPVKPMPIPAGANAQTKILSGDTAAAAREAPRPINPRPNEVFRTRVAEAPAAIHRSESFPPTIAEIAARKNISPPTLAI